MPIKIKKFDIEYSTEIPEPGYMFLGFNDAGELVQKDENGETRNVVSSMSGTTFDSIITPYLTVGGTRVSGYPWGNYTIAQGTSNTCIGDTSFVRGRHSQSTGDYSYASGLYVVSSGQSSYAWGVGLGTSQMLKSIGVNSFVHEYAISDTAGTLSDFSVILGGYDQSIGSASDCSVILGGHENLIESSAPNSFIIGGYDNIIPTGKNNVIYLGRTEFSEPIFDNTVYMTKLSLDSSPGYFVTGSTSEYNGLIWYDNSGSHNIYAIVNGEKKTLVQASGNFVYTDTDQIITGSKTFSNTTIFTTSNIISNVSLQFSTTNKGIITSDGTGTGNGFDTFIRTGSGSTTGKGGNITIQTGTGGNVSSGTAGNGGDLTITAGAGGISSSGIGTQGKGGNIIISSGNGGLYSSIYGIGGTVTISGGTGSSVSGNVEIYGGMSNNGGKPGDILLSPGIGGTNNSTVFVGVGTPNHNYKFHVSGNTLYHGTLFSYEYSNKAQFFGNWNQNLNDNWGIGSDGTTNSVLKIGRCDSFGNWNSNNVNMNLNGNFTISSTGTFINNGGCMNSYYKNSTTAWSATTNTVTDTSTPYWDVNTITSLPTTTDKIVYISIYTEFYHVLVSGLRIYVVDGANTYYFINWTKPRDSSHPQWLEESAIIGLTIYVPSKYSNLHVDLFCDSDSTSGQQYTMSYTYWRLGNYVS